jgi:hypothetical protein
MLYAYLRMVYAKFVTVYAWFTQSLPRVYARFTQYQWLVYARFTQVYAKK